MISIEALQAGRRGRWAVFDKFGVTLDREVPGDAGPATLLVSDVTDALKRVDEAGRVAESVDRSRLWRVEAIILDEDVLDRLEGEMTAEELLESVRSVGYVWQVSLISDP